MHMLSTVTSSKHVLSGPTQAIILEHAHSIMLRLSCFCTPANHSADCQAFCHCGLLLRCMSIIMLHVSYVVCLILCMSIYNVDMEQANSQMARRGLASAPAAYGSASHL